MIETQKPLSQIAEALPRIFAMNTRYQMDRQFRDEHREARSVECTHTFWVYALCDVATSVAEERALVRELGQDLHFAVRVYRRRPFQCIFAIAALATAIGVSTGVFTVAQCAAAAKFCHSSMPVALVVLRLSPLVQKTVHAGFATWQAHSSYLKELPHFPPPRMLNSGRDALRLRVRRLQQTFLLCSVQQASGRTFAQMKTNWARTMSR